MALSDESRALLQLLLARGRDYDQIADLLGVGVEEVRIRAEAAVGTLTGQVGSLESPIVDYLLGQADPIGRAEAVRTLSDRPDQAEAYSEARDQLILLFPEAGIPAPPERPRTGSLSPAARSTSAGPAQKQGPRTEAGPGKPSADASPVSRLGGMDGRSRTILAALIAAVGLAAIVGVVILLGGGGADQEVVEDVPAPTTAFLRAPQGGDGRGEVEFGFAGNSFAANISLSGLEPNRGSEGYALWLNGPAGSFPFDSAKVGDDGTITGQSQISQAIICFIAADLFTEVKVSRVGDAELTRTLRRAVKGDVRQADFPDYVGETALDGPISMPVESREEIIEACGGREAAASGGNQGS